MVPQPLPSANQLARLNSSGTGVAVRGSMPYRRGAPCLRGPCHGCGQVGHFVRNCLNQSQDAVAASSTEELPDKVKVVSSTKQTSSAKVLYDVYMPLQLFNRRVVALLDTGCDMSILGTCLLPKGMDAGRAVNK